MVAYSFKKRFIEPIRWGLGLGLDFGDTVPAAPKRQTIRADRRRHARPGEEVQLYTGMRTRQCRLIGRARCTSIAGIRIHFDGDGCVSVDDYPAIRYGDLDAFAEADGFANWQEMKDFWRENHPKSLLLGGFKGVIIKWEAL